MAYSDFTLENAVKTFNLTIAEQIDTFSSVSELESSSFLTTTLRRNVPLALASNTEKARSEMIIAPILIELREKLQEQISLFSGIDFTVDPAQGLNGSCDFLISRSPELLILTAPAIAIVEAKKENLNSGLGQCIAEMLAARLFNQRQAHEVRAIFGSVTSGTNWKFLKLQEQVVTIDLDEYYLRDVNKILGILANSIRSN